MSILQQLTSQAWKNAGTDLEVIEAVAKRQAELKKVKEEEGNSEAKAEDGGASIPGLEPTNNPIDVLEDLKEAIKKVQYLQGDELEHFVKSIPMIFTQLATFLASKTPSVWMFLSALLDLTEPDKLLSLGYHYEKDAQGRHFDKAYSAFGPAIVNPMMAFARLAIHMYSSIPSLNKLIINGAINASPDTVLARSSPAVATPVPPLSETKPGNTPPAGKMEETLAFAGSTAPDMTAAGAPSSAPSITAVLPLSELPSSDMAPLSPKSLSEWMTLMDNLHHLSETTLDDTLFAPLPWETESSLQLSSLLLSENTTLPPLSLPLSSPLNSPRSTLLPLPPSVETLSPGQCHPESSKDSLSTCPPLDFHSFLSQGSECKTSGLSCNSPLLAKWKCKHGENGDNLSSGGMLKKARKGKQVVKLICGDPDSRSAAAEKENVAAAMTTSPRPQPKPIPRTSSKSSAMSSDSPTVPEVTAAVEGSASGHPQ
ncbi:hypothetical protein GYMLUDRAFT_65483 [Collybiopsis luxurians FD-317 M1]|uniref:Uncharacterized protein n=1 Tax=Collybiopsis luxurians FD-317 M1 TaxID=944289 RepID=A0A0D0BKC7_9AGAR|nr:hypothetical protein GYMLUDRAFT_65483 [Collybiopsis luxurians FD-317 M1]